MFERKFCVSEDFPKFSERSNFYGICPRNFHFLFHMFVDSLSHSKYLNISYLLPSPVPPLPLQTIFDWNRWKGSCPHVIRIFYFVSFNLYSKYRLNVFYSRANVLIMKRKICKISPIYEMRWKQSASAMTNRASYFVHLQPSYILATYISNQER